MYDYYGETLTVVDVSSMLKICVSTVYRLINMGEIKCFRAGRGLRMHKADVIDYINKNRNQEE